MGVEAVPEAVAVIPQGVVVSQGPVQGLSSAAEGRWKDGLCNCFNQCSPTCLSAYCCQPCMVARFYDQFVKRGSYGCLLPALICWGILEFLFFGGSVWMAGCFSTLLGFYFLFQARGALRRKYNIPGDNTQDCCVSFWCYWCTIGQMYRHVRSTRGWCDGCDCNELGPVRDSEVMNIV